MPIGQGLASLSGPTRELMTRIAAGRIRHGGHPVLRWNAANLVLETDVAGNLKPSKARSTKRIDGLVAAVMAVALLAAPHELEPEFVSAWAEPHSLTL